jgi:hypothetical protein
MILGTISPEAETWRFAGVPTLIESLQNVLPFPESINALHNEGIPEP